MIIQQYKELYSILGDNSNKIDISDERIIYILSILVKKEPEYIENLPLKKFKKLYNKYINSNKYLPRLINNKFFFYNWNLYIYKPIEKWGDFVDINYFCNKDLIFNIDKIIYKLYKPIFKTNNQNFDKLNINKVYKNVQDVINLNNNVLQNYRGLFDDTLLINEEDVDKNKINDYKRDKEQLNKWKLLQITYFLCEGDITKIDNINNRSFIEVFNFLTYQKEQEQENQNNTNK
jgi:hypothetical protein